MRSLVVIFAVFSIGLVAAVKNDMIDIDVTTIKPSVEKGPKPPLNSGDGDDDEGSGVQSDDASGSGSGQLSTTKIVPTTKEVLARRLITDAPKPTKEPTKFVAKLSTQHVKTTEKPETRRMSTEKVTQVPTDEPTKQPTDYSLKSTPVDDSMLGGGLSNDPKVAARKTDKAIQVLTTEVIAAVVVGGVCAIILIAFLVYRLRKRDEGSYILTDSAYNDTNKLRGDTGKEAFV